MPHYVLDTSAVMAVFRDEAERGAVQRLLENARESPVTVTIAMPFIVLMEVEHLLRRQHANQDSFESAMRRVDDWPATVFESNEAWRRRAALVKATQRLSVADAWIAALALLLDELVHKDPEFDAVPGLQSLQL